VVVAEEAEAEEVVVEAPANFLVVITGSIVLMFGRKKK
jgi:hypothetical protein